jgi:hypothetical protein
MSKSLLSRRIPTILGILFLVAGIIGGLVLVYRGGIGGLGFGPGVAPKKISISNVADDQFTITWVTDEKTSGFIKYGTTPQLENIAKDERLERSSENTTFLLHYVTVKSLQPLKTYYFKISSGGRFYDNKGQAYTVTTGSSLGSTSEAKIVSGKILNPDNGPAEEVVVNLSSNNIAPMSALTDKGGRWVIFLNKARSNDLATYAVFDPEATILKIEAESDKESASAVTITKNSFPVPDMVLGHEPYDFREIFIAKANPPLQAAALPSKQPQPLPSQEASPSSRPRAETPSQFLVQPLGSSSPSASLKQVTIDNPAKDGEQLNTSRPEFQGKGPAYKVITLKIESDKPISSTVTVDENGQWTFTPTQALTPGNHTISASYVDDKGETKTLSRKFAVLAAGTSEIPALTATLSAKPSPISRKSVPSTEAGVPQTGVVAPTFFVLILGLVMLISGTTTLILVDKRFKL